MTAVTAFMRYGPGKRRGYSTSATAGIDICRRATDGLAARRGAIFGHFRRCDSPLLAATASGRRTMGTREPAGIGLDPARQYDGAWMLKTAYEPGAHAPTSRTPPTLPDPGVTLVEGIGQAEETEQ